MSEPVPLNEARNALAILSAALGERRETYAEGLRALELLQTLSKGEVDEGAALRTRLLALTASVTDAIFAMEEIRHVIEALDAADREGVQNARGGDEQLRRLRQLRNQIAHRDIRPTNVFTSEVGRRLAPMRDEASFASQVREAVKHFSFQEFEVSDIAKLLPARGVEVPTAGRQQIAMALSDLVRKGVIEVSDKGAGNRPNRYRRRVFDEDMDGDSSSPSWRHLIENDK